MRKTLMTTVATPLGDFVTELPASGFGISYTVLKYALNIFFLQRQNRKAAKKFRVKVEIPFFLCTAEVFKTQLIV